MSGYCDVAPGHPVHAYYHEHEYGFPLSGDSELYERLLLEINQAGLSWELILKKREGFRRAYSQFDIARIANYDENDRARLLSNPEIIRNKLKVNAAIVNAQRVLDICREYGSFKNWLDSHHPKSKPEWVKLFKATFKFTGGEIVGEFLMSIGYLPGAHKVTCPVHAKIVAAAPAWMRLTR